MTRRIFLNEDNASFYIGRPSEQMTEAGVRALVDGYARGGQLGGLLFCANVQRALFDSHVWEPLYIDYDPQGPEDQPCLRWLPPSQRSLRQGCHGRYWVHNLWLLRERGVDHLAVWLDQARRRRGLEGWLTVRMNDCHHNDREEAFWHSSFWKQHPGYRRVPYRNEGWIGGALDYRHDAVVEHHLALIRELLQRYDMDGIELDWVRFAAQTAPGREAEAAPQLTRLMRSARELALEAAKRRGHEVSVGVRLPADFNAARALGYDLFSWAREGLVDQIVLAPLFEQSFFEFDIQLWKEVFGTKARVLCQPEICMDAHPKAGEAGRVLDYRLLYGGAAAALQRGADGIYLFNECYRTHPNDRLSKIFNDPLSTMLNSCGDLEMLRDLPRRHPVSYAQIVGPGQPTASLLPQPLTKPNGGARDFNREGTALQVRFALGPVPSHSRVLLELGLDSEAQSCTEQQLTAWLNGVQLSAAVNPPQPPIRELGASPERAVAMPRIVSRLLRYDVPREALHDDINIAEIEPMSVPGNLVWAELSVW